MAQNIRKANPEELQSVLKLLEDSELPAAGVDQHFESFLVASDSSGLVGTIGLERYEEVGLLRSLAVSSKRRGSGLGAALVDRLLEQARADGVSEVYLLTTTAASYFPRHGFEVIRREEADARLQASKEFQGAFPDSAVCMRRVLS